MTTEEFKNDIFTLKMHQMLPSTLPEKFENSSTTGHFGITSVSGNLGQEMILQHEYRNEILFEKLSYFKECYMTKAKSLGFQIPPV